jgi:zinc-binding alcohol dehydrogenase/oxidoreductase
MKSYIIHQIGSLPLWAEKEVPTLLPDQRLLKIKASALNHRDVWITKGMYPGIVLGSTMGSDGVGTDDQGNEYIINPGLDWGNNQNYQSPDFRVLGVPDDGTFADYIAIEEKYMFLKPSHLTSVQAAALPLAGVTAYRSIIKRANLQAGEKVLISGIGGGVALFAMQFAMALGCDVYVTSGSEEKIQKAIDLGAKCGFLYKDAEWPKKMLASVGSVDVIVDSAAGSGFHHLTKVCNPGARIVFYGGSEGKIDGLNPQPLFWKQISILGSTMGSDEDFADMVNFVSHYKITPVVHSVHHFTDLHEGFKEMQSSTQFGKIVFQH